MCSYCFRIAPIKEPAYLYEYQIDTPPDNHQKWFGNLSTITYLNTGGSAPSYTPAVCSPLNFVLPPSSSNTRPGRAPDGAIASLLVLRYRVGAVLKPCFPASHTGLAPTISQYPVNQSITNRNVPSLRFSQWGWNHTISNHLIINGMQRFRCQPLCKPISRQDTSF